MSRKENLATILQGMGFVPKYDDEGDIYIVYQMKQIYFLPSGEDDEDNFLSVLYPQFIALQEGEESVALAICNRMTRDLKLAKVYMDNTFKYISGSCELFYANNEALEYGIRKALRVIGLIKSQYYENKKELMSNE